MTPTRSLRPTGTLNEAILWTPKYNIKILVDI